MDYSEVFSGGVPSNGVLIAVTFCSLCNSAVVGSRGPI
jgi:hypothetical protein